MKNIKKYAIVAAIVLPSVFSFGKTSEAAKARLNTGKASSVNVRSEAHVGNNLLGQIQDKKEYEIKERVSNKNGQWLKIEFDGKEAYVGAPWFNIIEETEVTAPSNFREKDSTNSKIIKVLHKGDKVEVLKAAANNYIKVRYNGKVGYLYAPNLKLKNLQVAKQHVQQRVATNYTASNTKTYSNNTYSAPAKNYSSNNNSYVGASSSAKEIIAQRESGGSYNARNGQYIGRYQLSASYLNGDYSAANQERVADNYVAQRYGSWENALAFWNNNGWY